MAKGSQLAGLGIQISEGSCRELTGVHLEVPFCQQPVEDYDLPLRVTAITRSVFTSIHLMGLITQKLKVIGATGRVWTQVFHRATP